MFADMIRDKVLTGKLGRGIGVGVTHGSALDETETW